MGAPTPKADDRRVQRTRRLLRKALIALMLERGWERISIQDVCERADVGRSTFYTHFADKEDLLTGGLDDLRKWLRARAAPRSEGTGALGFARGLIEHADENRRLFLALLGRRSGQVVMSRFRELVIDLVREELGGIGADRAAREATLHFVAGGFVELLTWWVEKRSALAPEELERLFLKMASPAVDALRKG